MEKRQASAIYHSKVVDKRRQIIKEIFYDL